MALAVTDLKEYRARHRKETVREQDLRIELGALANAISDFAIRTAPHRQRMFLVAQECGPLAMASWLAIEANVQRLLRQSQPEGDAA